MKRWWRDALISMGALTLLLIALVSIDDRVRDYFAHLTWSSVSPMALTSTSVQVRDAAAVLVTAAKDQSVAHSPMVVFAFVAIVLVLFMTRT